MCHDACVELREHLLGASPAFHLVFEAGLSLLISEASGGLIFSLHVYPAIGVLELQMLAAEAGVYMRYVP